MNVKKILGIVSLGGLLVVAVPTGPAQALSPVNPGTAAAVQDDSSKLTTEARGRRHHWRHRHWRRC